jgi:hypothetical protein
MDNMNKTMKTLLAVVAMGIGLVACGADSIGGSATVKMSVRGIYADGSSIDVAVTLGYAPTGTTNAVVKVGEDEFFKSSVAGSITWLVPTEGTYVFSHAVGNEVLSATYTIRDGSVSVMASGCDIYADGSTIAGSLTLGYAPTETTSAVVTIDGNEVVNSSVVGKYVWEPLSFREYTLAHTVGDIVFSATYWVTESDLKGLADTRLAENIKTYSQYTKYVTWVDKVAGGDVTARQAVKDSVLTWFAYALDLSALPGEAPTNVVIETIGSAAEGGWDLEVSVKDVKVGSGAAAADLGTVFSVEGAADLTEESFSADNVTTTFSATGDGKLKVEVEPKSAAGQFFFRMKMTP